jgi:peptidoglycan/LPS O-acetylase OafA/YrhL
MSTIGGILTTSRTSSSSAGFPPRVWSLAVEEQFYLIWPAVAFLIVSRFARKGLRRAAFVLALLSTAWMVWLSVANGYPDFADPSRAYFGTDSHAMGLLIGAALATAWRPGRLKATLSPGGVAIITAAGIAALLGVLYFFCFVGEFTPWLYRGGFLLLAGVVALLIAGATHPASPLGGWMGTQPFRYIGQRSYGLYLWHWPIFMLTRPVLDIPLDGPALFALRMALTFGIAELSFRFVEMPIRRGAIDRWVKAWRESKGQERTRRTRSGVLALGTAMLAVVIVGATLAAAPAPSATAGLAPDVAQAIGITDGGPTEVSLTDPDPVPATVTASDAASASASGQPAASASAAPAVGKNGNLSAIGDSVMLGARTTLKDTIPGTRVDAAVSRFPGAFIGRLKKYVAKDALADVVVLHPGTNGVLPESMMREMLDILEDTPRVVVVNDNMPRTWRDPNNEAIDAVVPDYPNAVLADWYAASKDHPEYFVSDGVHLTAKGARAYARLIKKSAGL